MIGSVQCVQGRASRTLDPDEDPSQLKTCPPRLLPLTMLTLVLSSFRPLVLPLIFSFPLTAECLGFGLKEEVFVGLGAEADLGNGIGAGSLNDESFRAASRSSRASESGTGYGMISEARQFVGKNNGH